MTFATRFNKFTDKFRFDTSEFEYKKLRECYEEFGHDKVYIIGSIFINTKNQFGANPVVAVTDGFYVNLPPRYVDDCNEMINDDDVVEAIKAGVCGFSISRFVSHGRVCFGVIWEDVPFEDDDAV